MFSEDFITRTFDFTEELCSTSCHLNRIQVIKPPPFCPEEEGSGVMHTQCCFDEFLF